jgi:hypothetical protein
MQKLVRFRQFIQFFAFSIKKKIHYNYQWSAVHYLELVKSEIFMFSVNLDHKWICTVRISVQIMDLLEQTD